MDTIADFLTILRNGYLAKKDEVVTFSTKTRLEIAKILKTEGYITDFELVEGKPANMLNVTLRYFDKDLPAIAGIKKVSKPSVRIYAKHNEIPRTLSGSGLTIVSTPEGLMSGHTAKEKHLGGEVICQVW